MLSFTLDVGLLYSIAAYIGMILTAIIFNRTRATKYREMIDKPFCVLLIFFMSFCFVDGTWGLFFSRVFFNSAVGYRILTYGFHYMAGFSAFVWIGYIMNYLKIGGITKKAGNVLRSILLAAQLIILTSNIWTGQAFVVDGNAVYTPGPFRTVLFWLQFTYYVIAAVYVAFRIMKAENAVTRKKPLTAIIYSAIPLIAGVLQLIFPDAPMYSLGFVVSAVTIYSFNITSQREAYLEEILTKENNKLTSIVSGLSGDYRVLYHINMATNLFETYDNRVAGGRLGFWHQDNEEDDFFEKLPELIPDSVYPEDRKLICRNLSKGNILSELEHKKSFSFSYRMASEDEKDSEPKYLMIKVIRSGIVGEKNEIIVGIFDETERMREEMRQKEELRTARTEAEAASRAKSKFLFNMSHDVRTPLNAILGFARMGKKDIGDPVKTEECLDKVTAAGNHLLSIIDDILDMSRIENGKVEITEQAISLEKFCRNLTDLVEEMARDKKITIVREEEETPAHEWVYADEMHLGRILMNILTNAIKYTPEGGTVWAYASEFPSGKEGISNFRFVIRDNGIGMSEEFLTHIYETFARERNSTTSGIQGTGLGMAITKSLVDLMSGTIHVDSKQGVGTTVTVDLPLRVVTGKTETSVDGQSEVDRSLLEGKYVLLVEDNELNREIAGDILTDFGMAYDSAEDGTVALEKCRALMDEGVPVEKRYDIILMDVQMPIMDGYTATAGIRSLPHEYFKAVPIIAMTANVFAEDIRKSRDAGMNAHLGKPINITELSKVIGALLK